MGDASPAASAYLADTVALIDQPHARRGARGLLPSRCAFSTRFSSATCASATPPRVRGCSTDLTLRDPEGCARRTGGRHRQRQEHHARSAYGAAQARRTVRFWWTGSRSTGLAHAAGNARIAHVPQSIYLADASIAENIAFGIPADAIDMQRVREAARRAQIAEFIEGRTEGLRRTGRGARCASVRRATSADRHCSRALQASQRPGAG